MLLIYILISVLPFMLTMECGHQQNLIYVKIPQYRELMSLTEFDKYVVNYEVSRMYVGMMSARIPHLNYYSIIKNLTGTSNYRLDTFGETTDVIPQCNRSSTVLIPASTSLTSPEAIFKLEETDVIVTFWSSCPTRYLWYMKCARYTGKNKCHLQDVTFELYVKTSLDDIPITDIGEDLCRTTGVRFGANNFRWVFTYGENTKCRDI
ncbi:uncharacterized protein LOC132713904 [Ruditapes philippinarum]|uniref:uncharacterized protein LOC132713904 n=1 Tax=Ruditapes philippinarum TaxID=129788 RepID=UPI00295B31D9|nr:uncharacterized protein LOC132713904 [Ruditapes philippinarum]